jgi:hypothetical protein
MKRRFIILATFLVFLVSVCASLFPNHASAATSDYYYTDDSTHNGIQGPNPYAIGGQSPTVTYHKTSDTHDGIYVAENSPDVESGGTCYPAIQTNDKKYDGDQNGKIYLDCQDRLVDSKGSVSIGKASDNTFQNQQAQQECQGKTGEDLQACTAGFVGGSNGQSKSDACEGFTGTNLSDCQTAWSDGQAGAAGGDTSPTCETSGSPLTWILCPIFDLLSDASSWIFSNIVEPFLITPPISTDPSDPSFQIWSSIRVYGDIFLVIALLVIVFGESIGGGAIDAYTAKKVLPRLLVAAVLINLSIYIVALMVDISNVLGKGVGDILTAPLTHATSGAGNGWDFSLSGGDQARVFGVGLIGLFAGGTAAVGFLGTIIFGGAAGVSAIITVGFFTLLPMFFAVLAVFITLIVRKGLILMLVLISPVAFALYCLPNTERYFRKWWDLLIEALMVYPIIVAIFAVADILSITILSANNIGPTDLQNIVNGNGAGFVAGTLNRTLTLVVAFLLQFLPLLAIPFAFRFASGALGRIYEAATGAGARINQLAESRREHAKQDYQAQAISSRARVYHASRDFGEKHQGVPGVRAASRFVGRRAGGYNIEAVASAARAEKMKQLEDQIATGRDEEIRGLTVNKKAALASGKGVQAMMDEDGNVTSYKDMRTGAAVDKSQLGQYEYQEKVDSKGNKAGRQFQSLGGAWIDEQDVDAGHSRWGRDQFAQQGALSYEMRKGITNEQRERIKSGYMELATDKDGGWGMSGGDAQGSWKGAGFANQSSNLEYKHLNYEKQKQADGSEKYVQKFNRQGFLDEVYEKRGSYDLSRMDAGTIGRLQEALDEAPVGSQQHGQLTSIAKTMQDRMNDARQNSGQAAQTGDDGEVQQRASSLGAGHVSDAMDRFVKSALNS